MKDICINRYIELAKNELRAARVALENNTSSEGLINIAAYHLIQAT